MRLSTYTIIFLYLFLFFSCKKDIEPLRTLSMIVNDKDIWVAQKVVLGRGLEPSNIPPFGDGTHKINFAASFTEDKYSFSMTINDVRFSEDYHQFYINLNNKGSNLSAQGIVYSKMYYHENKKLLKGTSHGKAVVSETGEEIIVTNGCFTIDLN